MIISLEAGRPGAGRGAQLGEGHVHLFRELFARGPMTISELFASAGVDARTGTQLFSRLCERGLVGEIDARRCSVTGRYAVRWDVIAGLPRAPTPPRETSCSRCRRPW